MFVLVALFCVLCLSDDAVPEIDPYVVLGVSRDATQSEIRQAYRALALQHHPDKNHDTDTSDIFATINQAYDILGNPDKRAVYDDFGGSNTGHTGFYSYWEFQQSNTNADKDFYSGDAYITRLTGELWDRRVTGKGVWLINFYATWCAHCQQSVPKYKSVAGRLDGVVEVGAFNCHKDQAFCQQFGITEYPTFILIAPELQFQQKMQLHHGDLEAQLIDFVNSKANDWNKLAIQSALINLNATTFEEELKTSEEFWIVVFVGGSISSKSKSYSARMNVVRLSANLRGLANTAIVDCNVDFDLCSKEFGGNAINMDSLPRFKGYARGTRKTSEELFSYDSTPVHVACEIMEKMVRLLMANERICHDGVCHAVAQTFEAGYEEYVEEEEPEKPEMMYQENGQQQPNRRVIEGRRPQQMLGR
eukprot:TRINITY_DN9295_c0_g1_i1.p1 TRINITY_DN9295_c0_g1~~TRINITY_DN9295_c0_g1_i1.p1  ORF type:complete len:419 (-),score=80.19 TRINITY_DN9295_c0_g1_i1:33-1289(-)